MSSQTEKPTHTHTHTHTHTLSHTHTHTHTLDSFLYMYCKHSSIKANTQHVLYNHIWCYHVFCASLQFFIYALNKRVAGSFLLTPAACSHQSRQFSSICSLFWSTNNSFIRWYKQSVLICSSAATRTSSPKCPDDVSLLRHSHNHSHSDETAIWSNLGFSILPRNIDRTADLLIREAVCFTSRVTASPEKKRISEIVFENLSLKDKL